VQEHLRLELGQGAELLGPDGPRLAESYGRLGVRAGYFATDLSLRLDAPRGRVSRVSATAGLDDGQGRALYAGWENVLDDGTDRTRQPIDLLFGARAGPGNARAQVLTFGGRFRLEGFTARYEALMFDRVYAFQVLVPGLAAPPSFKALTFVQHSLAVGYGPRCDCWRVEVYATQRSADAPGGFGLPTYLVPDFGATVSLTGFGAFGT
jgi:LPS-assembly protein